MIKTKPVNTSTSASFKKEILKDPRVEEAKRANQASVSHLNNEFDIETDKPDVESLNNIANKPQKSVINQNEGKKFTDDGIELVTNEQAKKLRDHQNSIYHLNQMKDDSTAADAEKKAAPTVTDTDRVKEVNPTSLFKIVSEGFSEHNE